MKQKKIETDSTLTSCYRLIAELLLYPGERSAARIKSEMDALKNDSASIYDPIHAFLEHPASNSLEEYTQTLELTPPCPLYIGSYLFDEPKSCRGAGLSGRNAYMIELSNIYRYFSFELNGRELADFLPVMVDFLAISLNRIDQDKIGLRRYFVEQHLVSGLTLLKEALDKYQSPYALLIESLQAALEKDVGLMADQPIWIPPAETPQPKISAPTG